MPLQMADEVLEGMTEKLTGDLTVIPKLARGQALRLLLAEERSRRLHSEVRLCSLLAGLFP